MPVSVQQQTPDEVYTLGTQIKDIKGLPVRVYVVCKQEGWQTIGDVQLALLDAIVSDGRGGQLADLALFYEISADVSNILEKLIGSEKTEKLPEIVAKFGEVFAQDPPVVNNPAPVARPQPAAPAVTPNANRATAPTVQQQEMPLIERLGESVDRFLSWISRD